MFMQIYIFINRISKSKLKFPSAYQNETRQNIYT